MEALTTQVAHPVNTKYANGGGYTVIVSPSGAVLDGVTFATLAAALHAARLAHERAQLAKICRDAQPNAARDLHAAALAADIDSAFAHEIGGCTCEK